MSTGDDILNAATRIYVDDGPGALSMRRVAKAVGVSATAIYRHFESKEALLIALGLRASRMFATYLMRALRASSPMERMREIGRAYRDFAMEHASYYRVLFMLPHPEFKTLTEETAAEFESTFLLLVDRVSECQREGVFDDEDTQALALSIWAHVHGLVCLYLDHRLGPAVDAEVFKNLFETSFEMHLRGMQTRL